MPSCKMITILRFRGMMLLTDNPIRSAKHRGLSSDKRFSYDPERISKYWTVTLSFYEGNERSY